MNTFSSLIAAELEENLAGGEPVLDSLDETLVELCACDSEIRPAAVVAEAFEKAGRSPELAEWLASRIGALSAPAAPTDDVDEARRRLRLANTVFDLAGLLEYGEADGDKVVDSLAIVWSHHEDWRKWAAAVGQATGMEAWLDPATVAETSPLMLGRKSHEDIKRHLAEVDALGDGYHPLMRDYCYYMHLRQIAERCQPPAGVAPLDRERWPDVAGFAMARIVKDWFERNPFFVTFSCHQLRAGVDEATWLLVAERVWEHACSTLGEANRQELFELLDRPSCAPPALERLAGQAAKRTSMILTPLQRHARGWR